MINYGKNKNVLDGNFQKTIRFAARLLERLEYSGMPIKRAGSIKQAGTKWHVIPARFSFTVYVVGFTPKKYLIKMGPNHGTDCLEEQF